MTRTFLFVLAAIFLMSGSIGRAQTTIEQQMVVQQNDKTLGGNFLVTFQVKGTNLSAANTLGSATVDILFDSTKIAPKTTVGTGWAFGSTEGYSRTVQYNHNNTLRIAITSTVNGNGGGDPPGYDIGSSYATWVTLNFQIMNTSALASLTVLPGTNAIGLYSTHGNSDESGTINNQTLSNPVNIVNVALPIQLSSFDAKLLGNSGIILRWTTLSEKNNYGFEIQKSLDANKDYQTVPGSFVKGAGTTIQPRSYSYTVATTDGKSWYYRLKQMDLDGSVSYSEGVLAGASVKAIPTTMALDQNYPNPFNPTTTIDFALPKDQMVTLEVFNILGQRVALLADGFKEAGYYSMPFDARELSSGLYFYRLVTKEQTFLKKMMVVK
jgi:hypothetical protein